MDLSRYRTSTSLNDKNIFVTNFIDDKITYINDGNIMNKREWFRYHNDFVVSTIKSAN